jgi:phosphoglucosamine mutase
VPQSLKNIRNIDKNIINNKIIQDMKVNMEKSLGDMGRILIRPSGTENIIRIMVESTNQKKVNEITDKLEKLIVEQDRFEKNK